MTPTSADVVDTMVGAAAVGGAVVTARDGGMQECAHVMKLLNRQLRDSAGMTNEAHKTFYRPTPLIQDGSPGDEINYQY